MAGKDGVYGTLQVADAFSVNDAHFQNSSLLTRGQIIWNKVADFFRAKRVQVKHTINRQLNWFVVVQIVSRTQRTDATRDATRTFKGKSDGASKV